MSDQTIILIVEDSGDDILLLRRAFSQAKLLNPLQVVTNGEDAIAYLSGTGKYQNRPEFPLPSLVLLDLKMPGIDGFQVLTWIRQNPNLRGLRVVVLTSSNEMKDVNRAYQLGANSFLVKPVDFERFVEISRALDGYWVLLDQPPEVSRPPFRKEKPRTPAAKVSRSEV
ncbi:MAG: response regulator [Limisphaerales bacterium]